MTVTEKNIDELESKGCGQILEELNKRETMFYDNLPALDKLAQNYGRADSMKLYKFRDLEWKWQEQYYKDHSEMRSIADIEQLQKISFRK